MSIFTIKRKWIQHEPCINSNELEATIANLQIYIGNYNITENRVPRSKTNDAIHIPVYYLAEWIAENWWVLLFEPHKDEESDDTDYRSRHSIVVAQHGFPLPDLSIVPFGRSFHLNSAPRVAPFANMKFTIGAFADPSREEVERELSTFLNDTVDRLEECGVKHTSLAEAWNEIKSFSAEEREFCELVGSLGLSPNEVNDDLSNSIELIYKSLGAGATRDFCLAATKAVVSRSIILAEDLNKFLETTNVTKLTPLLAADLPPENYYAPSWRRGMMAAKNLRDKLKIDIKDPDGADKIFDLLQIDTSNRSHISNNDKIDSPFSGAIDRHDATARIALLQDDELHRRFGACRTAYLGWVSEARSRRLTTNAVTRDQQASRSFAAEILVPQAYLKSLAGPKRELHNDQVREAARSRRAMPDVAFKQAYNANLTIMEI